MSVSAVNWSLVEHDEVFRCAPVDAERHNHPLVWVDQIADCALHDLLRSPPQERQVAGVGFAIHC